MKRPGDYVKALRLRCDLSRKEFGEQIGVTANAICMIENHHRNASVKLCYRILDIASKHKMKLTLNDLRQRKDW
jgi:DNA-binding XRE family transcriptional regulator